MPLIGDTSTLFAGFGGANEYLIEQSLLFDGASHLEKTFGSAGTKTTYTVSVWAKLTNNNTTNGYLIEAGNALANGEGVRFTGSVDTPLYVNGVDGTGNGFRTTSAIYRDVGSWYHVVYAKDTTDGTAGDRIKLYVNGVEVTSFSSSLDPALNAVGNMMDAVVHRIGAGIYDAQPVQFFHGLLAEFIFIDGQALTPSSFGRFDANGNWNPIDPSALNFGANGFWLDFADSSDYGKDVRATQSADGFTRLLIHSDTTDGSTTFVDSWGGKTISVTNQAQHDTAQAVFGASSILFDGAGDRIYLADDAHFELAGNNFLLEFRVRFAAISGNHYFASKWGGVSTKSFRFFYSHSTTSLVVDVSTDGSSESQPINNTWTPSLNTWYHIALVRNGNVWYVFVDGTQVGATGDFNDNLHNNASELVFGGSRADGSGGGDLNGWMDEIRLSNPTAVTFNQPWLSNFTPPTAAYDGFSFASIGFTAADQLSDSPTDDAANDVGNYPTFNPLNMAITSSVAIPTYFTFSEGNLQLVRSSASGAGDAAAATTVPPLQSGKYHLEVTLSSFGSDADTSVEIMFIPLSTWLSRGDIFYSSGVYLVNIFKTGAVNNSRTILAGSNVSTGLSQGTGRWTVEFDFTTMTAANFKVWKDGSLETTNTSQALLDEPYIIAIGNASNANRGFTAVLNFGQSGFTDAVTSDYTALCTAHLPAPTIKDPSAHFGVVGDAGTGVAKDVTFGGNSTLTADLLWRKNRDTVDEWKVVDRIRGATKEINTDSSNAESTDANGIDDLSVSDGFGLGTGADGYNDSGEDFVTYGWKGDGSTGASNTDGSITSTVSTNTAAGFSIVSFTMHGGAGTSTIGHGLDETPELIIARDLDNGANDWVVYHASLGALSIVRLNLTAASTPSEAYGNTTPTATVFSTTDNNMASYGNRVIAYCFHSVAGFSKVFSYTGNGSADGPFIPLDFLAKYAIIKDTSATENNWGSYNTEVSPYNPVALTQQPSNNNAEQAGTVIDINSNGIKIRTTSSQENSSGVTYVGIAWADAPFGGIGTSQARAR